MRAFLPPPQKKAKLFQSNGTAKIYILCDGQSIKDFPIFKLRSTTEQMPALVCSRK
jgi:hypothetical protein